MKCIKDVPLRFGTDGPIIGSARIYKDDRGLRIIGLLDKDAPPCLEDGLVEFKAFIPQ